MPRAVADEVACLELLEGSGQVVVADGRYRPARVLALDMRRDAASTKALRRFWTREALSRLERDNAGVFAYNVCGVSEADHKRLRALHAEYYQRMRELIARSEPVERVVVASFQLVPLD